jgi:hypothetical protein
MAPLVDTKVGRTWLLGFALISIRSLALYYLRTKKNRTTPLGLSRDCLPRLDSGVRVSNRIRFLVEELGILSIVP